MKNSILIKSLIIVVVTIAYVLVDTKVFGNKLSVYSFLLPVVCTLPIMLLVKFKRKGAQS
jgi:hypothetical protein